MKQYLVNEQKLDELVNGAISAGLKNKRTFYYNASSVGEELPPDTKVLTREQVIAACLKHAKAWDFEDKIANELFGGEG